MSTDDLLKLGLIYGYYLCSFIINYKEVAGKRASGAGKRANGRGKAGAVAIFRAIGEWGNGVQVILIWKPYRYWKR